MVFWIAHVHAHLLGAPGTTGAGPPGVAWPARVADRQGRVPPAGRWPSARSWAWHVQGAVWLALAVAVAGQVGWSAAAARRAGASWRLTAVTASINLLLGLLIISFKLVLTH